MDCLQSTHFLGASQTLLCPSRCLYSQVITAGASHTAWSPLLVLAGCDCLTNLPLLPGGSLWTGQPFRLGLMLELVLSFSLP